MIDKLDKVILQILQKDSRLSPRQIALAIKDEFDIDTSFSTVQRRIKKMEESQVIKKYTVVIDPKELGYEYPICFFLETDPKINISIIGEKLLQKIPELTYVHQVAGTFQIACLARCKNVDEARIVQHTIAQIEGIQRIVSHSILSTFKEDTKVPLLESD